MEMFKEIWENGIVSFDTCCLGRMYEWDARYAVDIKDAISYLFHVGELWETEINIQEFSRQRVEIKKSIYEQKYVKGIFNNLKKHPIPWNKIDGTMGRWEAKGFSNQFKDEIKKIHGKKQITEDELAVIVKLSQISSLDIDLEQLFDAILIEDGFSLTDKEKNMIQLRYNSGMVCPGSQDRKKNNGNKYNDLYIWELLKKKAKTDMKDIIFVTSDCKDDWFENKSPRPEYINEFEAETGQNVIILTLPDFWEYCKDYLDISVDKFIELSTIIEQIEEKYNACYQPEICGKIEELMRESDEIKEKLEDAVDCCVDMPVLDEIIENVVKDREIIGYDEENVEINIYLRTEVSFEAMNHTCGEDWNAGNGTVSFLITALAEIPIIWSSEDTKRIALEDSVFVEEITDIEVIDF